MLKAQNYVLFLILEILTVPIVITVFKTVEPRKTAAVFAGSLFLSLGVFIIFKSRYAFKSITLYAALIHLCFFSAPMLLKRVLFWNEGFDRIQFYGMTGTEFHKIAEYAFVLLFMASAIDCLRLKKKS